MVLARVQHACIIRENSIFNLNSRQQTTQKFEPGSQGPKAAMLTIELHSIDYGKLCVSSITQEWDVVGFYQVVE